MFLPIFRWLENLTDSFPAELPEQPPAKLGPFIWHYSRPFLPLIVFTSVIAAVVAVLEVYLFSLVGKVVDWLAAADRSTFFEDLALSLTLIGLLVMVLIPFLTFWYEAVLHQGLLGNYAMRTRWQAHRYLLRQSMRFFQDDFAGRIATKMMQTALGVRDVVLTMTEVFLYVIVYFTAAVFMFATNDWRLSIPMVLWLIGYVSALTYFVPRLKVVSKEQADARSTVTGRVVDSYTNIATVKMFADATFEDAYAREGMDGFLDTVYRSMRLSTLLSITLTALNACLLFSVGAIGIWLWQIGQVTPGALAFSLGLVLRLQGMSHWIMWEVSRLFEQIGVVMDGVETIARDVSVVDAPAAAALSTRDGEIRFEDVHFNYGKAEDGDADRIIHNFSLTVEPAEKIGIVGRSGAGKSTIVNLLLRFYDVEAGRILIDGQDIANVQQDTLRRQIGMVTQDTSLLHRSVLDNIRYGSPDATREEAIEAARRAHAHTFILDLEDPQGRTGYDAHVGERGVKLSGGQRQRVAIARVLLKNAPILILDEATSALDSEVEAAIQDSLYNLMEGKTVIAIAHRLSTIASMDRLVIMDAGQIIETGTHEELVQAGGLYAELWTRQSGGFIAREAAE